MIVVAEDGEAQVHAALRVVTRSCCCNHHECWGSGEAMLALLSKVTPTQPSQPLPARVPA